MAARCGLDSQQAGCLCFDSLMPSFAGHGWSTGLFEFMSPEAKEITDWGYVCTSCVCPCVQFYYNWLHILNGAPVWSICCVCTSRAIPELKVRQRAARLTLLPGRAGATILLHVWPLLHVQRPGARGVRNVVLHRQLSVHPLESAQGMCPALMVVALFLP